MKHLKTIFMAMALVAFCAGARAGDGSIPKFNNDPLQVIFQDNTSVANVNDIGFFEGGLSTVKYPEPDGTLAEFSVEDYFAVPGYSYQANTFLKSECEVYFKNVESCGTNPDCKKSAFNELVGLPGVAKKLHGLFVSMTDIYKTLPTYDEQKLEMGAGVLFLTYFYSYCNATQPVNLTELSLANVQYLDNTNTNTAKWFPPYTAGPPLSELAHDAVVVSNKGSPVGIASVHFNSLSEEISGAKDTSIAGSHIQYFPMANKEVKASTSVNAPFSNPSLCQPYLNNVMATEQQVFDKGCALDKLSTAIASPDLNGDGLGDLVVTNSGKLPNGHEGYATVYLGTGDQKAPFKYIAYTKDILGTNPYDVQPIDGGAAVLVTANDGVYKLFFKNSALQATKAISVPTQIVQKYPGHIMRPYHVVAAETGGDCENFAVTWADLSAANPQKAFFADVFSYYKGVKQNGSCLSAAYELVDSFAPPSVNIADNNAPAPKPLLAPLAFIAQNMEKNTSAALLVGDQRVYNNPKPETYAYLFKLTTDGIDTFGSVAHKVSKDMGYLEQVEGDFTNAGVRAVKVDKYGNAAFAMGLPAVFLPPPIIVTPNIVDQCPALPGLQSNVAMGSKKGTDSKGHDCYTNDQDCDGIPDWVTIQNKGAIACDNCPGSFAPSQCAFGPEFGGDPSKPCYNPSQKVDESGKGAVCKPIPANQCIVTPPAGAQVDSSKGYPAAPGQPGSYMITLGDPIPGQPGCYTNDKDCDGLADFYSIDINGKIMEIVACDSCAPVMCGAAGSSKCKEYDNSIDKNKNGKPDKCEGMGGGFDGSTGGQKGQGYECKCEYQAEPYYATGTLYKLTSDAVSTTTWLAFTGLEKQPFLPGSYSSKCAITIETEWQTDEGSGTIIECESPGTYLCGDPDSDHICSQKLVSSIAVKFDSNGKPDKDNCPFLSNPDQKDTNNDGIGDACQIALKALDSDGDKVPDSTDNCPFISNTSQFDKDKDGIGDACDTAIGIKGAFQSHDCDKITNAADKLKCQKACSPSGYDIPNIKRTGADSDGDGLDDAEKCDIYTIPINHPSYNSWKSKWQNSSNRSFNLISEAYAFTPSSDKGFVPTPGTVTVLVNVSKTAPIVPPTCQCLGFDPEPYASLDQACLTQLGADEDNNGVPDKCEAIVISPGEGIAAVADCMVDVGRDGQVAAGIGWYDSPYDKYIRESNDKIRQMFKEALKLKTGVDVPVEDLHVDIFIGELGYYHISCPVQPNVIQKTVNPLKGLAVFQTSGLPATDELYHGKDNRRISYLKTYDVTSAGQTMSLSADDYFKNSATRLIGTFDTPTTGDIVAPNTSASLDFVMPSIVASKKVQLVLQDSSAVAKTFNQETINGISVNLGPKEKPLVRITARQIPANMSLSALVPDIAIFPDATKFKSGAATLVDIEGFAGVDMGSWYHPDLVPPTLGQRNLDPNTVLKAVKTVLDNLVSDNSKQVTYANLVNGLKSVLASEGKTWDSTGYLNQELAIAKSLVPDGITPSVILYTNPLMNIPVQGGGGGGCSLVR